MFGKRYVTLLRNTQTMTAWFILNDNTRENNKNSPLTGFELQIY